MWSPSERITETLAENDVLSAEDKPLYVYGLHQLWITLLNLATAVAIGFLAGMLWEGLLFLAVYISLRKFAGGYHAKTELHCYVLSTILLCVALSAIYSIDYIQMGNAALLAIFFTASIVIVLIAPVGNPSKPLDSIEQVVYQKRSRIVLASHWGLFLVTLAIGKAEVAAVIVVADVMLSGMVALGLCKYKAETCNASGK